LLIHKASECLPGDRLQADKFTEISAVCTHPEYRNRGYAKLLLTRLCIRILLSGKMPILHVRPDNVDAVHTIYKLGFRNFADSTGVYLDEYVNNPVECMQGGARNTCNQSHVSL